MSWRGTLLGWLLAALALGGCAMPSQPTAPEAPPWRLVPATQVAGPEHLIVTVALDEPEVLAAMADALASEYSLELVSEWPLAAIDVHCFVFRIVDAPYEVAQAGLEADDRVRTVQPMQRFETLARAYDDELFDLQDGLHAIAAPPAHELATGRGVRVGVVDTFPDAAHPDLARRFSLMRDFVGSGSAAETHGTAVAGVIGADGGNARGIVGVAPDAELVALRGCWEPEPNGRGVCSSFSLARALNFALIQEVDVVNLSLGGPHDPLLAELVAALLERQTVVVAARGEGEQPSFPASAEGVISVAAAGRLAGVPSSALEAPGIDVLSTAPNGGFDFFSGSSVAAAHVSGIAALLLERQPGLTPPEVGAALADASADRSRAARIVNACAALRAAGAAGSNAGDPASC